MAPDGTVACVMGPGARREGLQARRGEEVRYPDLSTKLDLAGERD